MNFSFSKWPGARERHLIRRYEYPQYFEQTSLPDAIEITDAQAQDRLELAQFQESLQSLIVRSMSLTDDACSDSVAAVKQELDDCHYTAFGLGADLTEQKQAIASLNEVITNAMQRSLREKDDGLRLRLIQKEAARMEQLHLLEYPVVCDLLKPLSPIPAKELAGALLSESDDAYKASLEILDTDRKISLAKSIDIIIDTLESDLDIQKALRKLELLQKQLPDLPEINTRETQPEAV